MLPLLSKDIANIVTDENIRNYTPIERITLVKSFSSIPYYWIEIRSVVGKLYQMICIWTKPECGGWSQSKITGDINLIQSLVLNKVQIKILQNCFISRRDTLVDADPAVPNFFPLIDEYTSASYKDIGMVWKDKTRLVEFWLKDDNVQTITRVEPPSPFLFKPRELKW